MCIRDRLWAARGNRHGGQLLRILPLAAVNSGVLGTVLVERTQSFTLEQSIWSCYIRNTMIWYCLI